MANLPWKCWHEVVTLRDDLRTGELPMHMFAADLYEVVMQNGKRPIYEDPEKFFALTYPTYNLRQLVKDVVLRVAGQNDKAVRQLELTYGGGKTHTLITLRHLVTDPDNLPNLLAVDEFTKDIGQTPPKARVAALCFDKLDVEKGMAVRGPDGRVRELRQPWSVLAFQIAGDEGLKILHADNLAEERESAPAENLLTELLELPVKDGLGVLILIDEVLMYVREKVNIDSKWKDRVINFFQYLSQAATKVDRCCIVASLLASDPNKSDATGRQIQGELYDIFQRQREEAVEPVVKGDVAELLRRRFFTPESLKDREAFRPHVVAALKGISAIDDQTEKQGAVAEELFLRSFPFHPELTEIFYAKWTQLDRFQRTRGVLRTYALALREAEKWDVGPLIGPNVFLTAPGRDGLSAPLGELITVADTEDHEGRRQAWTGVIEGELGRAREIQLDSIGLKGREIEQAVVAVFLHSQPIGLNAKTRDLAVLLGATRPDRIELEKGLVRWAQVSFWLDDQYTATTGAQMPDTWRLGNRPNLTQMHMVAAARITTDMVRTRLTEETSKLKSLSSGATAAGVRVHTLPTKPQDIEDDGQFHYAILLPSAVSDSGKPSPEARRFIEETTGPQKPRVYRNALILLAPSVDGLAVASNRIREYLAWEQVHADLKAQGQEGSLDAARMHTLAISIDKSKGRITESIKQAYCIVITVSDKDVVQAFKINITDEPHFTIIKNDTRSRIQDTAIEAESLLPNGPYNLWRQGETSRRVKDLSGAFAQLPHLPKMLQAKAILDTLSEGCVQGSFVLKLTRPDGSFRTWWRTCPDDTAMNEPALELVLPDAAELNDIPFELLVPKVLPDLWQTDEIRVQTVIDYFCGTMVVQVQREGWVEPVAIPKAVVSVVSASVAAAVEAGKLWLVNGPSSIMAEPIPTGILTPQAVLRQPPAAIAAGEILPENLSDAWVNGEATALSIATALSQSFGQTMPWKTVSDVITASLNARFTELEPTSGAWPCDYPHAQTIKITAASGGPGGGSGGQGGGHGGGQTGKYRAATTELEPAEIQELGESVPELLQIKAKSNFPWKFEIRIQLGDGLDYPPEDVIEEINRILANIKDSFVLS